MLTEITTGDPFATADDLLLGFFGRFSVHFVRERKRSH